MASDDKAKRRSGGLGRGLSALLGDDPVADAAPRGAREIPIEKLHPNRYQPRTRFDDTAIEDLAASIKARGILQPILVRPSSSRPGEFEIVAGERRWRAAQRAKLHEVAGGRKALSDDESLEIAIVENVQRQDLSPIDEARGYRRLIDEFGHNQQDVADVVGKSRPHVANMMRLLTLPEKGPGPARQRRALHGPCPRAGHVGQRRMAGAGNRRQGPQRASGRGSGPRGAAVRWWPCPVRPVKDADTRALEKQLSEALGLQVSIDHKGPGGSVSIKYRSLDQLDDVTARLAGQGR